MTKREDFERVTACEPCVVCQGSRWCARLRRYHLCMKVESAKPNPKGGWLHPRFDYTPTKLPPPRRHKASDREMRDLWERRALIYHNNGLDRLGKLADTLGVNVESLIELQVGYTDALGLPSWTIPERNGHGWIVGIARRLLVPAEDGGNKRFCKGSRRGLVYSPNWSDTPGAIWLVEGMSDCAAIMSLGVCAVGRPNNTGGIDYLAHLLRPHKARRIIVCGENDRRPCKETQDCPGCQHCWPGKYGAQWTAKQLAKRLWRTIDILMPPKTYKDVREFFQAIPVGDRDAASAAMQNGSFSVKATRDCPACA